MLAFKEITISFDPTAGRRQREMGTAVFGSNVRTAQAVLKGYNIQFANGDHHILEQEIDLDTQMNGPRAVNVFADLVLRDSSGVLDDPYKGWINVVVIADVA